MIDKTLCPRGPQLVESETFVHERRLDVGIHISDGWPRLQGWLRCEHNQSPQALLNVSSTQRSLSIYCRSGGRGVYYSTIDRDKYKGVVSVSAETVTDKRVKISQQLLARHLNFKEMFELFVKYLLFCTELDEMNDTTLICPLDILQVMLGF